MKLKVVTAIIALLVLVALVLGPVLFFIVPMRLQMSAGTHYMNSLTPADIQAWIERTKTILQQRTPGKSIGAYGNDADSKPIPDDLKKLKILRIDVAENRVDYVWLGGIDHTILEVDRKPDGTYQVIAGYDDYDSKVLWPPEK